MKKQTLYCIAVSVLFILFGGRSASAQSTDIVMVVQIPFDFYLGEKQLPAGKYVIRRDPQMPSVLRMECAEQKAFAVIRAMALSLTEQSDRPALIFNGYGNSHFLSKVDFPAYGYRYSVFGSKTERKLARSVRVNSL